MRSISFVSANYVGRASNYPGGSVADWGKFDADTLLAGMHNVKAHG